MNLESYSRVNERTPICTCGHSEDDHNNDDRDIYECLVCGCEQWNE